MLGYNLNMEIGYFVRVVGFVAPVVKDYTDDECLYMRAYQGRVGRIIDKDQHEPAYTLAFENAPYSGQWGTMRFHAEELGPVK